jgi:hypothetical protein
MPLVALATVTLPPSVVVNVLPLAWGKSELLTACTVKVVPWGSVAPG